MPMEYTRPVHNVKSIQKGNLYKPYVQIQHAHGLYHACASCEGGLENLISTSPMFRYRMSQKGGFYKPYVQIQRAYRV